MGCRFTTATQAYCLWLGCMGAYDPQGRQTVLALARVLRHAGVTFGVLRKEKCTGDAAPAWATTWSPPNWPRPISKPCARRTSGSWFPSARTACAPSAPTGGSTAHVRDRASQRAFGPFAGFPHRPPSERVVFHDPATWAATRVYDQPRQAIAPFAEVVDLPRARGRSFCCGAGGGQMFLGEEQGRLINVERAKELRPRARRRLAPPVRSAVDVPRRAGALAQAPPKLLDIAQIVAAGLPEERPKNAS